MCPTLAVETMGARTIILLFVFGVGLQSSRAQTQYASPDDILINTGFSQAASFQGSHPGNPALNTVGDFSTQLGTNFVGASNDGGRDAFDNFGIVGNIQTLALSRHTDHLAGNVYRWADTYTNTSALSVSATLNFFGNLGSDGGTIFSLTATNHTVSTDGSNGGDPVVAFIWGNNAFANSMTFAVAGTDNIGVAANVTLAPGASATLLYYVFLSRDIVQFNNAVDLALAISTVDQMALAPNILGLSAAEKSQVINWNLSAIPEPSTYALLALGLGAVLAPILRRRRCA